MKKRMVSLILAVIMTAACFAFAPISVSAAESYPDLNRIQNYFIRTIGSLARADYYQTDVLASVTLSQACFESGYARYVLPVGGKNLFGIKAYNTWSGRVFDQNEQMMYLTYNDFLLTKGQNYVNTVSAWRAHESWAESVASHSGLFTGSSSYAAVVGEKDYKKAAYAIVAGGYCTDPGYADTVIRLIEQYGFTEYDDLVPDEDGVVAITANSEQVSLDIDGTFQAEYTVYPAEAVPSSVLWHSDNEAVATVDETGLITAVAHGMSLITATLANGREACFIVSVDCNATVVNSELKVRLEPSSSASDDGKFPKGMPVKVLDETVIYDDNGNGYYAVTGYNSKGKLVTGYALAKYIYITRREVSKVSVISNDITLVPGDVYTPACFVAPADAVDTSVFWQSSDPGIAAVDENGVITAIAEGAADITASAVNGVGTVIRVTVGSERRTRRAITSGSSTLTIRKTADESSATVGRIPFLSEVTVKGEPDGIFYKVTGVNTSGKTITGYAIATYLHFLSDDDVVTRTFAGSGIKLYEQKTKDSFCYGTLIEESECAVIENGDEDEWKFVIGKKKAASVKAIYGYAKIAVPPDDPGGDPGIDPGEDPNPYIPEGSHYALTGAEIYVHSGPGTVYATLGTLPEGAWVIITGEPAEGWASIVATDSEGETVVGFCPLEYLIMLYNGTTKAKLNLRSGPGTSYSSLAQIPKGAEITVIGEKENGWYRVEYNDLNGYCSADYVNIVGYILAEPSGSADLLNGGLYTVEGNYLLGVKAGTTAAQIADAFNYPATVKNAEGTVMDGDSAAATGCTVFIERLGITLTVIVKGDVSGDGQITANDYMMIKRAFLGTYLLSDPASLAARVSGSEYVTVADYMMIKRVVLGTYEL
ncbi:MAG: SH3 domain-containing protein [Clostridia bacterium]|nr:SH3 domain-containing protein [Clostridia bacterium]